MDLAPDEIKFHLEAAVAQLQLSTEAASEIMAERGSHSLRKVVDDLGLYVEEIRDSGISGSRKTQNNITRSQASEIIRLTKSLAALLSPHGVITASASLSRVIKDSVAVMSLQKGLLSANPEDGEESILDRLTAEQQLTLYQWIDENEREKA